MQTTTPTINEKQLAATLKKYGVVKAALFGSFARDDAGPHSDIDLLVTYRPDVSFSDVLNLQNELEAESGRSVDLVSEKYAPERLMKRIKEDIKDLAL